MSKDPAFLFYPNDWLGGTMGMTFEQKGAYIDLLMMQFNVGHMGGHMVGQVVGQIWDGIKHKFIQDEKGLWYNERLEEEKFKRKSYVKSRNNNLKGKNQYSSKGGHKGGHTTSHMEDEDYNSKCIEDKGGVGEKETSTWYGNFKNHNPHHSVKYPETYQDIRFAEIWDEWCKHREDLGVNPKKGYIWSMQKNQIDKIHELTNGSLELTIKYLKYAMQEGWYNLQREIVELREVVSPKWKDDYDLYLEQLKASFDKLVVDKEFHSILEKLYPGIDVYRSMVKAYEKYWKTEDGWEKKKKVEYGEIDWRSTLIGTIEYNMIKK